MKQNIRYTTWMIANKLKLEIRMTVDRPAEWVSEFNGAKNIAVSLLPFITLTIVRTGEVGDDGNRQRPTWNPNDSLSMTTYNYPVMLNELQSVQQGLKTPELYTYTGKRLELNEEESKKVRRVFKISNTTLELTPVVITQPEDDSRVEGIKMKFNNEQSHVLLTLNDIDSLIFNLNKLDVHSIAMMMYQNYTTKPDRPTTFNSNTLVPVVDITPKDDFPM